GERVPTLAEMLETARGSIRLNIELKYNRPDPALAPQVVEMLRAEEALTTHVLTSLDYAAVRKVKELAPEATVGLIVTKSVGDPARLEADFLAVSQSLATEKVARRA